MLWLFAYKCKEQQNFCSYCNQTDHAFNECKATEFYCTNCGGIHNAYNYRQYEKYKNLKRIEVKKEIEYLLGLASGTLSRREVVSYSEYLTNTGSYLIIRCMHTMKPEKKST